MLNESTAVPISRKNAALHIALGVFGLLALWLPKFLPQLAPYSVQLDGIATALGVGSIAAARAYLPPRVRAILETFAPTPVLPQPAGTTVLGQVKP